MSHSKPGSGPKSDSINTARASDSNRETLAVDSSVLPHPTRIQSMQADGERLALQTLFNLASQGWLKLSEHEIQGLLDDIRVNKEFEALNRLWTERTQAIPKPDQKKTEN